jgi:hypothetical protein
MISNTTLSTPNTGFCKWLCCFAALALFVGCGGSKGSKAISIVISPPSPTVEAGAAQQFTAKVDNTDNKAVEWSVASGGVGGTITQTGLYTAPFRGGIDRVVATSAADTTKTSTATITVNPPSAMVLNYTDPPAGTGFRFVRNESLSTPTHLVLDLVASGQATQSAGLTFAILCNSSNRFEWAKVSSSDPMLIQNGTVFNLGTAPLALKSTVSESQLKALVSQKGIANLKDLNSGVLARIALDVKQDVTPGDANFLVNFFQVISATGAVTNVNSSSVALGTLTATHLR